MSITANNLTTTNLTATFNSATFTSVSWVQSSDPNTGGSWQPTTPNYILTSPAPSCTLVNTDTVYFNSGGSNYWLTDVYCNMYINLDNIPTNFYDYIKPTNTQNISLVFAKQA